jgi:hypothetical protein
MSAMTADLPTRTGHQLPPIHRMPRVFLPNFDFEHQLAERSRSDFGEAVRQINAELASVWLASAEPGDAVWSPAGKPVFIEDDTWSECSVAPSHIRWVNETTGWLGSSAASPQLVADSPSFRHGDELCPWGWSEQAMTWGQRRGLICHAPPIEVVCEVNSRRFSFELETTWGVGLDGAALVQSLDHLRDLLADSVRFPCGWIIKALLGMSGRERLVGRGAELMPSMLGWLRQRLVRDGAVILEPWLDRIAEAGLQWDIPRHGEPVFVGVVPMIEPPNSSGGYFGSRIDPHESSLSPGGGEGRGEGQVSLGVACEQCLGSLAPHPRPLSPSGGEGSSSHDGIMSANAVWSDAVDVTSRVAQEVQRRGYFGPLGIDAMLYRDDDGQTRLRPIQDVNARYTMGRLALGWRRFLKPNEFGSWLHLNWIVREPATARERIAAARQSLPDGVRVLWTSPVQIGDRVPRKQTVLLAAPTSALRAAAEQALIQSISGSD